jgi:hypothetical protein
VLKRVPLSRLHIQQFSTQEKETAVENALDAESAPSPSQVRRRARSASFIGTNLLVTPLTDTEYRLSSYRKKLNQEREEEERVKLALTARITQSAGSPLPIVRECNVHSRFQQISTPLDPTILLQDLRRKCDYIKNSLSKRHEEYPIQNPTIPSPGLVIECMSIILQAFGNLYKRRIDELTNKTFFNYELLNAFPRCFYSFSSKVLRTQVPLIRSLFTGRTGRQILQKDIKDWRVNSVLFVRLERHIRSI